MRVKETLSFEQYWADPRFRAKRPPETRRRTRLQRAGDNCYCPVKDGEFRQLRWSGHWDKPNDREDTWAKKRDLGGQHVLVSRDFAYFGEAAPAFPRRLANLPFPGRGHRVNFSPEDAAALMKFLEYLPRGKHGRPHRWKAGDSSWREETSKCG
jgi:hypothetical protein